MADDIQLPGTGLIVKTDEVNGVHLQVVKFDLGADGVSIPVSGYIPTDLQRLLGNPVEVGLGTVGTGTQRVVQARSATATVSSVAAATGSTTVLASNTSRHAATIYNDSASVLYLKLGSSASSTSFTTKLFQDDYYEVPGNYTGIITGVWVTATGSARVTELT